MKAKWTRAVVFGLLLPFCISSPLVGQFATGNAHYFQVVTSNSHIGHQECNAGSGSCNSFADLTALTGAPVTATISSPLTGFGDNVGDHLFYPGTNQHLYQLYYCGANCSPLNTWLSQDITAMANDPQLLATTTKLSSFTSGTQEHVVYEGSNQHIYQLVTTSSGGWTYRDLTATTGGPIAATASVVRHK